MAHGTNLPLLRSAVKAAKGSKRKFAAASTNVGIWHNVRAQPEAFECTQTAALPTFGPECRVIGGFQTRFRWALNAYC